MKRRTALYRDGLIFLGVLIVVFLGAVVRQVNLLLLFASILFCFVVFDWRLGRRTLIGLSARRKAPSGASAGEPFLVSVELENSRRKLPSWGVVVEDTVTPLSGPDAAGRLTAEGVTAFDAKKHRRLFAGKKGTVYRPVCYFEEIGPRKVESGSWAGRLPRRGLYRLGPMTVSTRFPLGFFRSSTIFPQTTTFFVAPKIGKLSRDWFASLQEKAEEKSRHKSRVERFGEEMFGIREWQPHDARKWIHQRASAKYRKLLVRQFQRRTVRTTALVLDLFDPDGDERFAALENRERAVSFSATLLTELTKRGAAAAAFGLIGRSFGAFETDAAADDAETFFCRVTSGAAFSAAMERLATAGTTSTDSAVAVLTRILAVGESVSRVVFVTTRPLSGLADKRFAATGTDSRFSALLGKMTVIDASSPTTDEIFKTE